MQYHGSPGPLSKLHMTLLLHYNIDRDKNQTSNMIILAYFYHFISFQKTTLVYHLKEKKVGHSPTFCGIAHSLRCVKK